MGVRVLHHLFNVGVVDEDKLHRVDLSRNRLAATDQTNIMPEVVGKGFVRPGTEYMCTNKGNGKAKLVSFIAGQREGFRLELTDYYLRVAKPNDVLVSRAAVTASVTNGDFSSATGWTLASSSGQVSSISGGFLLLTARAKGAEASAKRSVTINEQGVEHALRIVVARGPVTFRLGTSDGAQDLIEEMTLRTGYHSLAFTPNVGTVYLKLSSRLPIQKIVDSIQVEAAGVLEQTTSWPISALPYLRADQSLDIMFLACQGYKQQQIERHGDTSWSVCHYDSDDGPFLAARTALVTLTPGALEGNTTLTASAPFFTANHVGALFRLDHNGQRIDTYIAAADQYTDPLEITGVNETSYNDRDFTYTLSGTWSGTVKNQRSFDSELTGYQEFRREQSSSTIDITANATYINDDNEDNAIGWYRLGIEAGGYTSGEVHITGQYAGGSGYGICRVVGFTNSTTVDVEVLRPFKGNYATTDWRESAWSAAQSWPSALLFAEGRLWWLGEEDGEWGSVSDAYYSFDESVIGDAGPISRSIALGGRNRIQWAVNMGAPIVGTDARIVTTRANTLDDTITPENFKNVPISKVGAASVSPVELSDDRALFVEPAGVTTEEISYSNARSRYVVAPFSKLTTELFALGITEMATSLIPDQRIWVTVTDSDAVCIVFEAVQQVVAFIPIATKAGDIIESVCVLPGEEQDRVYWSVARARPGGGTDHFTEKLALDREAKPVTVSKCMDCHISGTGAHSATVTAAWLANRTDLVAWIDGEPYAGPFTADGSGNITLPVAPTEGWCVGIPYPWVFESARLEYAPEGTTPVTRVKSVKGISLLLADYVRSGIRYRLRNGEGQLSTAEPLRALSRGKTAVDVVVGTGPTEPLAGLPGGADPDNRVVIQGASPYPASLLAMILEIETYG